MFSSVVHAVPCWCALISRSRQCLSFKMRGGLSRRVKSGPTKTFTRRCVNVPVDLCVLILNLICIHTHFSVLKFCTCFVSLDMSPTTTAWTKVPPITLSTFHFILVCASAIRGPRGFFPVWAFTHTMYGVRCATLHRFDATARRIAASSDATTFWGFALRVLLHNFGLCPTDVCIFYCVFGKFPHNCRICRYEICEVGDDPACAVTN